MRADASILKADSISLSAQHFVYLLLAAVAVLYMLPIWSFKYTLTTDGPVHLHIAEAFLHYDDPAASLLRRYYELNLSFFPNWFIYGVLDGLLRVLPALTAEKLLLSAYVIGLPLAARYAARPLTRNPTLAAFFVMPLSIGYPFEIGLYNFSFGIVFALLGIGQYLRADESPSLARLLGLGGIALLTYFCHLFAAASLLLVIGLAGLWRTACATQASSDAADGAGPGYRRARISRLCRAACRHAVPPALALLPTLALILVFLLQNSDATAPEGYDPGLLGRVAMIVQPFFLIALSPLDLWLSLTLQVILLVIWIFTRRSGRPAMRPGDNTFLFVFLALCAILLLFPVQILSARIVLDRLSPYLFVACLLWLSGQPLMKEYRAAAIAMLALFSAGAATYRLAQYADINENLGEFLTVANSVEEHSTILFLQVGPTPADNWVTPGYRIDTLRHAAAHIARERHGVYLNNIQATTNWFPLRYRDALNPYRHIAAENLDSLGKIPPDVDILDYEERTGGRIDYILVWGPRTNSPDDLRLEKLAAQLRQGYDLIETSPGRGLMRLYRRKDLRSGVEIDEGNRHEHPAEARPLT